MLKIVPLEPQHLIQLSRHLQESQLGGIDNFDNDEYFDLLLTGQAFAFIDTHTGLVIMCSGVYPMTDYMGRAWALLSKHAGKHLLRLTKISRGYFLKLKYDRIDTTVDRSFINGHKWCKLLGFIRETNDQGMRCYGGDSKVYDLYAFFPKEFTHGQPKPVQETKETRH